MVESVWHVPTTLALYEEFDNWCPWCNIRHTCPSGWAWVKYVHENKLHLCHVEMEYYAQSSIPTIIKQENIELSVVYSRIDRRLPPTKPQCGMPLTGKEVVEDISIGGDHPECCLECWDRLV